MSPASTPANSTNNRLPVYERMRSPIKPPLPRALHRPTIRVKKWRLKADVIRGRLFDEYDRPLHRPGLSDGYAMLRYLDEWIRYAEAILNGECSPDTVFSSTVTLPPHLKCDETINPSLVHKKLRPFDSSFCLP